MTGMRTGSANLPLHGGAAPRWLFQRMVSLSREITRCVVEEYGPLAMLERLSDPYWFQAFGCVLGFDWHSSGVTTTVTGALKQALKGTERDLGLYVAGGKGKASRQTPTDILTHVERAGLPLPADQLVYASRLSAKVDNSAVQDGYQLYHHCFLFTAAGEWAVVQQGMNEASRYARRYHWLSRVMPSFVNEPHAAICAQSRGETLNMVAQESEQARAVSALLAQEKPERLAGEIRKMQTLTLPRHHQVLVEDLNPQTLERLFAKSYARQPQDFEQLLGVPGIGPKSIRALSLIAELVHGVPSSRRDPARFSFAHGGKDGHPYPVDRENYDRSIEVLRQALAKAKLGHTERLEALSRLTRW